MSSVIKESNEEFEDQFRLQREAEERAKAAASVTKRTRVDDDGTVMEWDEERQAWFPMIDDDFIASYQMNFGVQNSIDSAHTSWRQYAAQMERLKAEKGEEDEEVKKGLAALEEYYKSPAYRAWYDDYLKRQEEAKAEEEKMLETIAKRSKGKQVVEEVSADEALRRAEEEQRLGIPIASDVSTSKTEDNPKNVAEVLEKGDQPKGRKRKNKGPPEWYDISDDKNTHVYVSGLPPDVTEAEFTALMSKCGIIMNDPLTDKLRVKLYRDADGKPKGDGRCCYIKIESVDLALNILDGMVYKPGYTLRVERAKFQPKKDFDHTKHRRMTAKEKKKFKQKQESLFKWKPEANKHIRGKKERVIILRDVFDEKDLGLDVSLIPEIRERVRVQCAKVGVVKKIVVHDAHTEGVVAVTFSTPEEADVALTFLDGALFTYRAPATASGDSTKSEESAAGLRTRQLRAERWDGRERFDHARESAEEEAERMRRWSEFLGAEDESSSEEEEEEEAEKGMTGAQAGPVEDKEELAVDGALDTDEEGGIESGAETE